MNLPEWDQLVRNDYPSLFRLARLARRRARVREIEARIPRIDLTMARRRARLLRKRIEQRAADIGRRARWHS